MPRYLIEREMGPLSSGQELIDSVQAVLLAPLSDGGLLFLTRRGSPAAVHFSTSDMLCVHAFEGSPAAAWQSVNVRYPGVRPGVAFSRFWLCLELAGPDAEPLYGILDLATMDVLERGCNRETIRRRVSSANADPAGFIRELEWARSVEDACAARSAAAAWAREHGGCANGR